MGIGVLSLALGIAGIFLPILPTTPFLLLTAFCFSKGSPRLHAWLLNHKQFGPVIVDWQTRHVIRLPVKILATFLLLPTVLLAFSDRPLALKVALLALVVGVLTFIWTKKSQ